MVGPMTFISIYLALSWLANKTVALVCERHDGRGCARAFSVLDDLNRQGAGEHVIL